MPRRIGYLLLVAAIQVLAQQYPFVLVPNSPGAGSLLEDSRGGIWVSSPSGLRYFDGTNFYRLDGFDRGTALVEDSEGGVWIEHNGALYRFLHGKSEQIATGVGTPRGAVAVAPDTLLVSAGPGDTDGDAWLLRVVRYQSSWKVERVMDLDSFGTLTVDAKGTLLFPCHPGWCEVDVQDVKRWIPGSKVRVTRHSLRVPWAFGAGKVIRDRFGCVWIRSEGSVSYQCPGEAGMTLLPQEIASENGNADISEGNDGSILITSNAALSVGRPGRFATVAARNGLPTSFSSIRGRDGTVWILGTQGLYRFSYPFRLEYWTARDGLSGPTSIARSSNRIFAASGEAILVLSEDGKSWRPLSTAPDLQPIWHLLPTQDGTLLAAAPRGVAEFRSNGVVIARSQPGSGNWGAHLAQSSDGQIWLSGFGIDRLTRRGKIIFKQAEPLPEPRQNGLDIEFEPTTGRLVACYAGGLAIREGGQWRIIKQQDGLLQSPCRSMAAHPNGDIWFAYNVIPSFALVRAERGMPPSIRQFHSSPDIGPADTLFLDVDQRGWLWRGTSAIYVADPASAHEGRWLKFDAADGLPPGVGNQNSFYSDPDGSVWWGSDNNIIHFRPPPDFVNPTFALRAFIAGYSWNGGEPRLSDTVHEFPYGSNVTAHIGSLQFDRRNALRVRYRLLPDRQAWLDSRNLDLPLENFLGAHTR